MMFAGTIQNCPGVEARSGLLYEYPFNVYFTYDWAVILDVDSISF